MKKISICIVLLNVLPLVAGSSEVNGSPRVGAIDSFVAAPGIAATSTLFCRFGTAEVSHDSNGTFNLEKHISQTVMEGLIWQGLQKGTLECPRMRRKRDELLLSLIREGRAEKSVPVQQAIKASVDGIYDMLMPECPRNGETLESYNVRTRNLTPEMHAVISTEELLKSAEFCSMDWDTQRFVYIKNIDAGLLDPNAILASGKTLLDLTVEKNDKEVCYSAWEKGARKTVLPESEKLLLSGALISQDERSVPVLKHLLGVAGLREKVSLIYPEAHGVTSEFYLVNWATNLPYDLVLQKAPIILPPGKFSRKLLSRIVSDTPGLNALKSYIERNW